MDHWIDNKDILKWQFTVLATTKCTVLNLKLGDLNCIKLEFYDQYFKLFDVAHDKLKKALAIKLKSIKLCS